MRGGQGVCPGGDPFDPGDDLVRLRVTKGQHLPAGACGADDPESPACAAGSGFTVSDAWSNHTENAARCAEDRARYERLKDYLRSRP